MESSHEVPALNEKVIPLDIEHPISIHRDILRRSPVEEMLGCENSLELSFLVRGEGRIYVGDTFVPWKETQIFMGAINEPRWISYLSYPSEKITVRFLPTIISEWGQNDDALVILDRFLAGQDLENRIVSLPPALAQNMMEILCLMEDEYTSHTFGWRMRLQSLLVALLTDLVRWEFAEGRPRTVTTRVAPYWKPVLIALSYIRTHFKEPIYARQIESITGLSEVALREAFRKTLDLSWIRFLERIRIQNAVLMLRDSSRNITEIAFEVGFESLSHFNRAFKAQTGLSPRAYVQKMGSSE
jgi:AraC-like DNA-binding protein